MGQLLSSQQFPSAGGGSMLTSRLSFQTNAVKPLLILTPFQFQLFWSKVTGHVSSVGLHCPARIYLTPVQIIKKSGGQKEIVYKYFVS